MIDCCSDCKICDVKYSCEAFNELKNYEKGRADAIEDVELSLREAGYEYDENMGVGDNVGSAMLGAYAKGYNKGYEDKCLRVANAIDEFVKELEKYVVMQYVDIHDIWEVQEKLKERKNEMF